MGLSVAVLGATGLVGQEILKILEGREFPLDELVPLASAGSAGRTLRFRGKDHVVRAAEPAAFADVDIVLSSAGGATSRELLPAAAEHGAVSIDNTSAFRMDSDVPLVVPEVNAHRIGDYGPRRILANPNCSTIQLVVALAPIAARAGLRRVIASTYQAVSGAGRSAVEDLEGESRALLAGEDFERQSFPRQIAFNALPHIDVFLDDGDTREEWKMQVETPKILEREVAVHATCVRIPVVNAHSEAIWVETEQELTVEAAREALAAAPGLELVDDPQSQSYPTAVDAAGRDAVYVGRLRRDPTVANGLAFWVVADNLRKGAALNAVQIAEALLEHWEQHGRH